MLACSLFPIIGAAVVIAVMVYFRNASQKNG